MTLAPQGVDWRQESVWRKQEELSSVVSPLDCAVHEHELSVTNIFLGDSQDTPMKERRFRYEEEVLVVNMDTQKEGNQRSKHGGRKLYFDKPGTDKHSRWCTVVCFECCC